MSHSWRFRRGLRRVFSSRLLPMDSHFSWVCSWMFFVLLFAFSVPSPYVSNSLLKMHIWIKRLWAHSHFPPHAVVFIWPSKQSSCKPAYSSSYSEYWDGKRHKYNIYFSPKDASDILEKISIVATPIESLIRPKTGNDVNLINFCKRNSPQFRRPIHLVLKRTNRLSIYPQGP